MKQSQIKLGRYYAVSTVPRKGVADVTTINSAHRVRVDVIGVARWAETAGECQDGAWKNDGIQGVFPDHGDNTTPVFKARDFLMEWDEYNRIRTARAEEEAALANDASNKLEARRRRVQAVANRLEGMGLTPYDPDEVNHLTAEFFITSEQGIRFTLLGIESLMEKVTDMVYEASGSDT